MRKFVGFLAFFVATEMLLFALAAMIDPGWASDNAIFVFVAGVALLMFALAIQNRPKIAKYLSGDDIPARDRGALLNPRILRADYKKPHDGSEAGSLVLWVSVTNVGSRATSIYATGVHISFHPKGEILNNRSTKLLVVHPPSGIKFDDLTYPPSDAIYETGSGRIASEGGRVAGFIAAELPLKLYNELLEENGRIVFVVEDAEAMTRAGWIQVSGQIEGVKMQHIVGLTPSRASERPA